MKKKKLILNLKKDVISNLQAKSIVGGNKEITISQYDVGTACGSEAGCLTGPDATMTCPNYSCAC